MLGIGSSSNIQRADLIEGWSQRKYPSGSDVIPQRDGMLIFTESLIPWLNVICYWGIGVWLLPCLLQYLWGHEYLFHPKHLALVPGSYKYSINICLINWEKNVYSMFQWKHRIINRRQYTEELQHMSEIFFFFPIFVLVHNKWVCIFLRSYFNSS